MLKRFSALVFFLSSKRLINPAETFKKIGKSRPIKTLHKYSVDDSGPLRYAGGVDELAMKQPENSAF